MENSKPPCKKIYFQAKSFFGIHSTSLRLHFHTNSIQEYINTTDILPALSTDHSPVLISFCLENIEEKSAGFWKFNSSLLFDDQFTSILEAFIKETKTKLNSEEIDDPQIKWEFFKYEIRKFVIKFSKLRAKN